MNVDNDNNIDKDSFDLELFNKIIDCIEDADLGKASEMIRSSNLSTRRILEKHLAISFKLTSKKGDENL